jgi:hypothetical protein
MRKQTLALIASAAFLASLQGIAGAQTVKHRSPSAKLPGTVSEAALRKLKEQNVYGLALANSSAAAPRCDDITCPGFALVGIGF